MPAGLEVGAGNMKCECSNSSRRTNDSFRDERGHGPLPPPHVALRIGSTNRTTTRCLAVPGPAAESGVASGVAQACARNITHHRQQAARVDVTPSRETEGTLWDRSHHE